MKTKPWILQWMQSHPFITSSVIVSRTGISRQAAAKHLRELAADKKLFRTGSTRNARYIPFGSKIKPLNREKAFSSAYTVKDLQEDRVFQEAELRMGLPKKLSKQAQRIAAYAFCEMLNNAIDHSHAATANVRVECNDADLRFEITDRGVGAFESMRKKFKLQNHQDAAMHLLKGKQTTFPERHSGQGIFFTSKIADQFRLESARLRLTVDNQINDVALSDIRNFKGTKVTFILKRRTRKDLKKLFDEYSDSDYEFDKTNIVVRLSEKENEAVSRSQARRILFGLEKFKRIVLDFKRVQGIGQSFADEVFRVFQNEHPDIKIEVLHASASVEFMIKRACSREQ